MKYFVYLLECADKTYYCGYTTNLEKRIHAHNHLKNGAKYTAGRRPVVLKYFETFSTLREAMQREWEIKSLSRDAKRTLIFKNIP